MEKASQEESRPESMGLQESGAGVQKAATPAGLVLLSGLLSSCPFATPTTHASVIVLSLLGFSVKTR